MGSIRDVKRAALECRDARCQWEHVRRHDSREPMWGTRRWDLCVRCGNWRSVIERSDGRLDQTTRAYDYSVDYMAALQWTREDCRIELNRRARVTRTGRPNLKVVVA